MRVNLDPVSSMRVSIANLHREFLFEPWYVLTVKNDPLSKIASPSMSTIRNAVRIWIHIHKLAGAVLLFSFGLIFLVLAASLIWWDDGFWLVDIFSVLLGYVGVSLIFAALSEFTGEPKNEERMTRNAPRRMGR